MKPQPNDAKLGELILHIAHHSTDDETFGMVKLNKLLFDADFMAYLRFGQPITGQEYVAREFGPCPRRLVPVMEDLKERGHLVEQPDQYYQFAQRKIVALRQPDLDGFTAKEIALVDSIIARWKGKTAREMSDLSHQFVGWRLARPDETIPYETVLIGHRRPTSGELKRVPEIQERARKVLARDGA